MADYRTIPAAELGKGSNIKVELCETEVDLYWKMAIEVLELIQENNAKGEKTVMIVPYGPLGPYARLVELINAIPGLSCRKPHGAFYVMMNIRGITGKRCHGKVLSGSTAIAEALLEHAHVALVPGAAFLDEGFCRISYATSMENIEEGLRRIAAFVKELE